MENELIKQKQAEPGRELEQLGEEYILTLQEVLNELKRELELRERVYFKMTKGRPNPKLTKQKRLMYLAYKLIQRLMMEDAKWVEVIINNERQLSLFD